MRVAAFDWPSFAAQKSPQEAVAERSTKLKLSEKLDVLGGSVSGIYERACNL